MMKRKWFKKIVLFFLSASVFGCSAQSATQKEGLMYTDTPLSPSEKFTLQIGDVAYIKDVLYVVVEAKNLSPDYIFLNSWDFTLEDTQTLHQIISFKTFSIRLGVNSRVEQQLEFEVPTSGNYRLKYEGVSFDIYVE